MRIIFFGTPEFAVPSLRALLESKHEVLSVVAQPDRPAGRGLHMQAPAVARFAAERGLPVLQPEKIRNDAFLDQIRRHAPDLGVVIAYGKILPVALLEIPRHGFVNVHASLLPKYRGAAPIQRAIETGERETGVTIMNVDAELDHGPMLSRVPTPIGPEEHTPELARRLSELGAAELVRVLDRFHEIEPVPQDHAAATYAPKIEKEEGRITFDLPARIIFNRFRAFDPWPGIFISFHGETVKLTSISVMEGLASPGEIVAMSNQGLDVGTGEGLLRVAAIQRPGKRPARAAELARTAGLREGMKLV